MLTPQYLKTWKVKAEVFLHIFTIWNADKNNDTTVSAKESICDAKHGVSREKTSNVH